jgi:hypothetical protein
MECDLALLLLQDIPQNRAGAIVQKILARPSNPI